MRKRIPVLLIACLCLLLAASAARADAAIAAVDATSWIVGKDPSAYAPQRMVDGNEATAFQFSLKSAPLGSEYLYFHLAAPGDLSALWIKNGFWKITDGKDQYLRNSRVKSMNIAFAYGGSLSYGDAQQVTLPDDRTRADWTRVDFSPRQGVTSVRFQILSIYKGSKYPNDVCISEVRFSAPAGSSVQPGASTGGLWGLAIDKLATRDGPGTNYAGKGTYSVQGQSIRVLSRAWDARNSIWWVKCEIPYHGEIRVLWTGYKRFDSSTLPLESIPIETVSAPSVTAAPVSGAAAWQARYRTFFVNGEYLASLSPAVSNKNDLAAFAEAFRTRNTQYDTAALCDMDGSGVPELIILTAYAYEQADVFTFAGGQVKHLGTMAGDNFFQDILSLSAYGYPGLFTLMGGPAMTIAHYTVSGGNLFRRSVGATLVNSDGDATVGLRMDFSDNALYVLLYGDLVGGQHHAQSLRFRRAAEIASDAQWAAFCAGY